MEIFSNNWFIPVTDPSLGSNSQNASFLAWIWRMKQDKISPEVTSNFIFDFKLDNFDSERFKDECLSESTMIA